MGWNKKMKRGVFAYSIDSNMPSKQVVDADKDFVFELLYNPNRAMSKKGFVPRMNVKQKWNEKDFNFYGVDGDNLMAVIDDDFIDLNEAQDAMSNVFNCYDDSSNNEEVIDWSNKHLILCNKYPIGSYSGLFVPFFGSHSAQILSLESIRRAIHFSNMFFSDSFRIGFNSMAAMASVNMLHFQFWQKIKTKLAIEVFADNLSERDVGTLHSGKELIVRQSIGYPIRTLIYEQTQKQITKGLNADIFGAALHHCILHLIQNNVPHNLLINKSKIFLFVRQKQRLTELPIFYGFTECAGWITILNKDKYQNITMQEIWNDIQQNVSIQDDEKWEKIKTQTRTIYN